jgi:D-glycero-alpha-D-manno-heptose-7-phosphate kinase
MVDNTAAQAALHPDLVSREAAAAIDAARRTGCAGWKVNGAGGEGGSLALLLGEHTNRDDVVHALADADPSFAVLPTRLARRGLRVQDSAREA